jgi:hypothetical protein
VRVGGVIVSGAIPKLYLRQASRRSPASNGLIDVENLSEDELKVICAHYKRLATMAKKDMEIGKSHSIEEAHARHSIKKKARAES